MRSLIASTLIVLLLACSKGAQQPTSASAPSGEKTYPMTATIVSRDPGKNTLNLDNKEVPGEMMAMKMDYEVRGAKVGSLPPDGTAVEVTVHDRNGSYYITDVKAKK